MKAKTLEELEDLKKPLLKEIAKIDAKINIAKKNKIKIAMSLSDIFCVTRHKQDFYNLLKNDLNILIGNENEINE